MLEVLVELSRKWHSPALAKLCIISGSLTRKPPFIPSSNCKHNTHPLSVWSGRKQYISFGLWVLFDIKQIDDQIFLQQRWIYWGSAENCRLGCYNHGEPRARKEECFYKEVEMTCHWLYCCQEKREVVLFPVGLCYGHRGLPGGSVAKNLPPVQETQVWSLGREDPMEKEMAAHSSFAWKSHGQRSPADYCPWGCIRVRHDLVIKTTNRTWSRDRGISP